MLQILFEQYDHHGNKVWVRPELKGKHRIHCLCHAPCKKLDMVDREKNCPIAQALYENCVKHKVVTPVWECPNFEAGEDAKAFQINEEKAVTYTANSEK
ncbi:hypothetical protein ACFLQL_00515 [Verrucomicrobiota bacterium]